MGVGFRKKLEFAAMMDNCQDWYAWGLKDLRAVKGTEYSIKLTDPRPVFATQSKFREIGYKWGFFRYRVKSDKLQ
jgi:hypothetical protein